MTEFFKELSSTERFVFLVSVLIFAIVAIQAVRHGLVSFKGKGLRIGTDGTSDKNSKRMRVIKAQMDFLLAKSQYYTEMVIRTAPAFGAASGEINEWYIKYVVLFFIHIATEWIVFEKIKDDKDYIKAKQKRVIASSRTMVHAPLEAWRMIDNIIETQVEELIKELVDVEKGVK